MGTDISTGFRFRSTDFFAVSDLVDHWRPLVRRDGQRLAADWMARECAKVIDDAIARGEAVSPRPLVDVRETWQSMQDEIKAGRRNPEVDFEFEIMLFPHAGQFYGMVLTEQRTWLTDWMKQDLVEPLPYWSGEPPDGVTEEAWQDRAVLWDGVMPSGIPINHGFSSKLHDPWFRGPTPQQVLAHLPSFDTRVSGAARRTIMHRIMSEQIDWAGGVGDLAMVEILRMREEIQSWIQGSEGAAALVREKERLAALLPWQLTHFMLLGWGDGAPLTEDPPAP